MATAAQRTRSSRSTSSRIGDSGEPVDPVGFFELHFAAHLIADNGRPLRLEEWQRAVLRDVFSGTLETVALLPKGQGKTTLFAAVALWHLLTTPDAMCYVAAASRDQATLLYDQARGFVARTPGLASRLKVQAGYREIKSRRDTGRIRVIAADADTADGTLATLALVDELHRHRSGDLYATLFNGLPKRGGQIVTISTAGVGGVEDQPLWQLRQRALTLREQTRDGSHLACRDGDGMFVLHEWAVPDDEDPYDLDAVKRANPASFVTIESLRARRDSPSTREVDWLRFACNRWVESDEPWLMDGAWHACHGDASIPDGAQVSVGVDIGVKHDSSAVVWVWRREDGKAVVGCRVFLPPAEGALDLVLVENAVRELARRFRVREVAYDPFMFERSAQMLEDEGLVMVTFPQTNERMAPASQALFEAINAGALVHDGDPVLTSHVLAGASRETERGWRISKGKTRRRIDALIALLMAHQRSVAPPAPRPWVEVF